MANSEIKDIKDSTQQGGVDGGKGKAVKDVYHYANVCIIITLPCLLYRVVCVTMPIFHADTKIRLDHNTYNIICPFLFGFVNCKKEEETII